jgi:trans-2,3-dihydro-3-hydroxyanthranilate isomerase
MPGEHMQGARSYAYRLVDVFTQVPFQGNQLAVFTDAAGLDDSTMQYIARELNLAETTFVFPASLSGCVAQVRIFTPCREMLFAGHPTIGTAYVLMDAGRVEASMSEFVLQENVGPVAIRVARDEANLIWLRTPAIRWGNTYQPALCARVLGLSPDELLAPVPQWLSAGNPTLFIPVRSPAIVDRASLSAEGMRNLKGTEPDPLCVFVFALTAQGVYSRMFAPEHGVAEDPATGSATGPLAAYLMKHRLVADAAGTRLISEQGVKMLRRSILHVRIEGPAGSAGIYVGGHVVSIGEGSIRIPAAVTPQHPTVQP